MQIIEQIAILFNPSLEIQSTDNYIDWTSLSLIQLTDVTWSSRTVPLGAEEPIDVATLTFEIPIWISPPAKIKRLGVIQKIINSIFCQTCFNHNFYIFTESINLKTCTNYFSYNPVRMD